ncbi:MAG: ATP-dependent acyl-CoA ligase [Alphaproteobacteria bacterium]|nr:ATP-dependent acyl-CoA ligase [Alphaproteobacteria bacterium]
MPTLRHPLIHPFAGWDINRLVAARAVNRARHPFLIWEPFAGGGESITYADFADRVARLAAGLVHRGVKPGDFLLIHLDNCLELLVAWYACARAGAIAVTTNARSSADELSYFAAHCGAVAGITQPRFAELVNGACHDLKWLAVTETDNGEPAPTAAGDRFARLYREADKAPARPADPLAPVGVQYTSGTTSRPKGVLWTHANALWGARVNATHQDLRADDVHLTVLPLFHTNAQAYSVAAALWVGATAVIQPRFSASRFWPVALRHRCTWASLVPFCVRALMDQPVPPRHHFRLWGNAQCEPPTDRFFHVKTIGWWGMTETMSHGIVGLPQHDNRPLSMGKAAPEYGIAVLDDSGRPVAPGASGHLRVLGVPGLSLFKEYLNNAKATADSFDEAGWFITGDRVTLHEDGFLSFADRDKDMLKVGGENVGASEIERVILSVGGVREAAVVGERHPMLDEVPVAFVLPDGEPPQASPELVDRVLAACRRHLADFKVPRQVVLVDSLPRSTLEKVAKAELRRRLAEGGAGR